MLFSISVLIPIIFCVVIAACIVVHHIIHSELAFEVVFDHCTITTESMKPASCEKKNAIFKDRAEESGASPESLSADVCSRFGHVNVLMQGDAHSAIARVWTKSDLLAAIFMQLPRPVPHSPSRVE